MKIKLSEEKFGIEGMEIEVSREREIDSRDKKWEREGEISGKVKRKREGEKKMRKSKRAKEKITYEVERDSPRSIWEEIDRECKRKN